VINVSDIVDRSLEFLPVLIGPTSAGDGYILDVQVSMRVVVALAFLN
jgi:hypothetical protein